MLAPFIDDPDFRLYVGDVRELVGGLEPGSIDCVVTSPPYWGLRDYGTADWSGGTDPECDHEPDPDWIHTRFLASSGLAGATPSRTQADAARVQWRKANGDTCPRCGATFVDRQIGLEGSPQEYVDELVGLFAAIRPVLADHGTVWLNLGDSYASSPASGGSSSSGLNAKRNADGSLHPDNKSQGVTPMSSWIRPEGLKPKDLVGIPWRVAFALQADGWYLRSDIIWSKPNPMPESVTDRPTKSHEYVFLLSKRPRYFFDQEAVREAYAVDAPVAQITLDGHVPPAPASGLTGGAYSPPGQAPHGNARGPDGRRATTVVGGDGSAQASRRRTMADVGTERPVGLDDHDAAVRGGPLRHVPAGTRPAMSRRGMPGAGLYGLRTAVRADRLGVA